MIKYTCEVKRMITNPIKAIRAKCLECSCENPNEVRECPITDCALYPFRFGRNPYHKRELSEEQKAILAERMRKIRG